MRLRKNILNKKSHCLVFGFFLFCLGLYLFSYSYITNKRQEIFDSMNFKLYEQGNQGESKEEIDVPEITVAEVTDNKEVTEVIEDDGVVAPEYKDNANYIGTITIPKINLKALIAEGTEDDVLCNYIGHFSNTGIINGNVNKYDVG